MTGEEYVERSSRLHGQLERIRGQLEGIAKRGQLGVTGSLAAPLLADRERVIQEVEALDQAAWPNA